VAGPTGKFRADQLFEPNADGADMIIPEITFSIAAPDALAAGRYPIRAMGCATADMERADRRVVEAHTTVMIGPLLDVWNYTRRPLSQIAMTVIEPFDSVLSAGGKALGVEPGGTVILDLKLENVPDSAALTVIELPEGVTYQTVKRGREEATVEIAAEKNAKAGSFEIFVQALVGTRRVAVPVTLRVEGSRAVSSR
jgi:hypothetical protein